MSNFAHNNDVQKLLGEKEHLKKEEETLRHMIEKVKTQINAIQVEQLQVSSRLPVARISPVNQAVVIEDILQQKPQDNIPEINLDILGSHPSNKFSRALNPEEEEEEEEEEGGN